MSELFRRVALGLQRALNFFDPACRAADPNLADGDLAPILIVGPPRSGTTLLFQALSRTAKVAYISNVMAVAPVFMVRIAPYSLHNRPAPDAPFGRGDYGFLPGFHSPSEAGKVIDRWFNPDHLAARRSSIRSMAVAIGQRMGGQPLLIKAIPLGLHLGRVHAVFPNARFVLLKRDPVYVVQSLFEGQSDPSLAADRWEGVQPEGFEAHAENGIEHQTAWQIAEILRRIEAGLGDIAPARVARVQYEAFCAAPAETLDRIGDQLGVHVATGNLPHEFPGSARQRVTDAQWNRILQACADTGLT